MFVPHPLPLSISFDRLRINLERGGGVDIKFLN